MNLPYLFCLFLEKDYHLQATIMGIMVNCVVSNIVSLHQILIVFRLNLFQLRLGIYFKPIVVTT
jgi:hypothetical protein